MVLGPVLQKALDAGVLELELLLFVDCVLVVVELLELGLGQVVPLLGLEVGEQMVVEFLGFDVFVLAGADLGVLFELLFLCVLSIDEVFSFNVHGFDKVADFVESADIFKRCGFVKEQMVVVDLVLNLSFFSL